MAKRTRGTIGSPDKQNSEAEAKKMKEGEDYICPICLDKIVEDSENTEGHDAVYCEGTCDTWIHRRCAGLSKTLFKVYQNSDKPYHCPHCKLLEYETLTKELISRLEALENRTTTNEITTITSNLPNNHDIPPPAPCPNTPEVHISTIVSSYINEEKEKSKRRLNLIVHNLEESSAEDVATRQKYDTDQVSSIFQNYVGVSPNISKAIRLGKRQEKARLLKITVSSESDKAAILRNVTKLHKEQNPENIKKLYVTPDMTKKGARSK